MLIEEVLGNSKYTSPIQCDEAFQMKILVEGTTEYYQPVDFRLNQIHVPLESGDVEILYNKVNKETNIYKNDVITRIYYPPSTGFTLVDGTAVTVLRYGPIKKFKGMSRVTVYCKLVDEETNLIETIPNTEVLNKILGEMNRMLISNEELKRLMPNYNYNWMLYNAEGAEDANEAAAIRILNTIADIEYQEMCVKQDYFYETFSGDYDIIPTVSSNEMAQFAKDFIRKRYRICYDNVSKLYRMKSIANWLIHIAINHDYKIDYNEISILNKYKDHMKIKITANDNDILGTDIIYDLTLPNDSDYNYRIELLQVVRHTDNYISYDMDAIVLYQINKTTGDEILLENASNQVDNFLSFMRVLEILSGDIDRMLSEYYNDIPNLIAEMDVSNYIITEDDITEASTESLEQKLVRIINNSVDEQTLPRVQEILTKYVLEGSLTLDENGVIESIQDGGSSAF